MKQLTLPYNLNQTGKKIGSAKILSQKKCFNKPHQRAMVIGQAEMPEWEDQLLPNNNAIK